MQTRPAKPYRISLSRHSNDPLSDTSSCPYSIILCCVLHSHGPATLSSHVCKNATHTYVVCCSLRAALQRASSCIWTHRTRCS
eukprot:30725-Eustigmatos_ZCMA.PRE.1